MNVSPNAALVRAKRGWYSQNLRDALSLIGVRWIGKRGDKVLVNPNLCGPYNVEGASRAIHTSMPLIAAVLELTLDSGIRNDDITVAGNPDPGGREMDRQSYYRSTRITEVNGFFNVKFCDLPAEDFRPTALKPGGRPASANFSHHVFETDILVNLPILKTHRLTLLSGAYKNIMGLIDQETRRAMHGDRHEGLAGSIVGLYGGLPYPTEKVFHFVDAITAQEGEGPRRGSDIALNAFIVGQDPLAVDVLAARVMGVRPEEVETIRLALAANPAFCCRPAGVPVKDIFQRRFRLPGQKDRRFFQ
ncbi:MAG: DUF362 domain-containing protein [Candidatus Saganbacteria bacterium]|nr:DUF362 domain-containing protein [Candidatus Saganbacteria bacterium]